MTIRRRKLHQTVFALAGVYNLAWGAHSILDPNWMFRMAGMEPLNHPEVWACLGMVIGLYGLAYLDVARSPETGVSIAIVGFLGKLFGPIGMAKSVLEGAWPPAAALLCIPNDVIWWIPFSLYLYDAWPALRRRESSPEPNPVS